MREGERECVQKRTTVRTIRKGGGKGRGEEERGESVERGQSKERKMGTRDKERAYLFHMHKLKVIVNLMNRTLAKVRRLRARVHDSSKYPRSRVDSTVVCKHAVFILGMSGGNFLVLHRNAS